MRRCRPLDGPRATAAWLAAYRRGERRPLTFRHSPPPALGALRAALGRAAEQLPGAGALGALYAARAAELELEAQLAEHIGCDGFANLARRRHTHGASSEWAAAQRQASAWLALAPEVATGDAETRHAADDRRAPNSLVSILSRELGQRRLALRVEVVAGLTSRAACGDGVIYVRAGERLTPSEARRIAAHELMGHALPRLAARSHPLGLLRVGSARSSDDEEGRALHIEAQLGLLDGARRRELALRHTAALAVAGGGSAAECVELLGRSGCACEEALAIYARVARGGGLCRELEYLPAWLRFSEANEHDAELAAWLARGRVSLEAARVLRAHGVDAHSRLVTGSGASYPVAARDEGA